MPYITREDGERFVIPSYRDIISAKKTAILKKEIMLLSSDYGEYITMQRKSTGQYEVAFSQDPGYLLGETVWHYFKRPYDLIYCEAIPNTSEAILVIVKGGSVYLDGSFPVDSIPEELVIFRTQQNSFEIYIHGDVPISQVPEAGKFALDSSSVRSFTVLDTPVFPTLPTVRAFQLQLVNIVLKEQGIGVIPLNRIIFGIILLGAIWMGYLFLTVHEKELPITFTSVVNPYQNYLDSLTSPSPTAEIDKVSMNILKLFSIPGWYPVGVKYETGNLDIATRSLGIKSEILYSWAMQNQANIQLLPDGFHILITVINPSRVPPDAISPRGQVIATVIDRLSNILPGNSVGVGSSVERGRFGETIFTINFNNISLAMFELIGDQFKNLPLVLIKMDMTIQSGTLSGTITLKALGS